jgi:protein translocase SecG subunit
MNYIIGLLTGVLALDSLLLIVLVLAQPSKKEAGMGAAFGGGATDVLLGAGSGNFLTTVTKYSAGIFLGLCLLLSILGTNQVKHRKSLIEDEIRKAGTTATAPAPAAMPVPPPATPPSFLTTPSSNATVALPTNATSSTVTTQGNKRITITPVPSTNSATPAPDKK